MSVRDLVSAIFLIGVGYTVGKGLGRHQKQFRTNNDAILRDVSYVNNIDYSLSLSDIILTPLQSLDAQFDAANQVLTDALVTARQKIIDHPGNSDDLDPVPGRISAKQAALAITVMGRIGQLAEVAGAVGQVTSGVQGMKDEAEKMKSATEFFSFGSGLLSATDAVITVVERSKAKS
ncbi:MAG: hypothetical protein ACRYGK_18655 [Janthinobacterium lividum]